MANVSFLVVALTLIAASNAAVVLTRYTDSTCGTPYGEVITTAKNDFTIGKCMGGTFNSSASGSMKIDIKSKSCSSNNFVISMFAATGNNTCSMSSVGTLTLNPSSFKAFWAGKCAAAIGVNAAGSNIAYQKVTGLSGITVPACFTTTTKAPTTTKTVTEIWTKAPTTKTVTEIWTKAPTTAAPTSAAPATPTMLTGSMNLKVPNATAFLKDMVAQQAVKKGIADLLSGVSSSWIALVVTAARRLEGSVATGDARRLAAHVGPVKVAYSITIPANATTTATAHATALSGLTVAQLTTSIKAKLGAGYEAMSVTSKTEVTNSKSVKKDTTVSGAVGMFIFGPAVFLVVAVLHQVN